MLTQECVFLNERREGTTAAGLGHYMARQGLARAHLGQSAVRAAALLVVLCWCRAGAAAGAAPSWPLPPSAAPAKGVCVLVHTRCLKRPRSGQPPRQAHDDEAMVVRWAPRGQGQGQGPAVVQAGQLRQPHLGSHHPDWDRRWRVHGGGRPRHRPITGPPGK